MAVKLVVGGQEYALDVLAKPTLGVMAKLQKQAGIGPKAFGSMFARMQAEQAAYEAEKAIADKDGTTPPEEPDVDLDVLGILIFLARLQAGEKVTWAQVQDTDLSDVRWESEEDDAPAVEGAPVDPTSAVVEHDTISQPPRPALVAAS